MINNPAEDEIDAIRLKLYEQTRGMTASEATTYVKKQIAPTVEKYNISAINKKRQNPLSETMSSHYNAK
jgi:hypothetical protein